MGTKNFIRTIVLLLFAGVLIMTSCVKEGPMGLPGLDGTNAVNGKDGKDGKDGTASCVACHNKTTKETIFAQFSGSTHGIMPTKARSTNGSCAGCHSAEGFIESLNNVLVKAVTAVPNPSAMNCESCHTMHQTFDFANDGPDYALRTTEAVPMFMDKSIIIDMEGASNLCVNCHQPRTAAPIANAEGNFTVTSTHYGPHYGAQAVILEGVWGYLHPQGSTAIPAAKSAAHRENASCTSCHMHDSTTGTAGGHTWEVGPEACTSCHTSITTKDLITASKAGFYEDFNALGQKLLEIGALRTNTSGGLEPNPQQTWPIGVAGALWNYRLLYQDHSGGIHNPAYARALLKNSLEALN